MKTKYAGVIVIVLAPFILAIMTYIIELFLVPKDVSIPSHEIVGYFAFHLIWRLPFFLPAFWVYKILFNRTSIWIRLCGLLYAISVAYLYATAIFSNDLRLNLTVDDKVLMPINYCLTALILWSIYEILKKEDRISILEE